MHFGRPSQRWFRAARAAVIGLVCAGAPIAPAPAAERVVISEFMAANTGGVRDRDREFSDWIEIYNGNSSAVNLGGWFLTDDQARLTKWRFPDVTLAANEYLVVFASGKNRRNPGVELHTNFKLEAGGGYLALVKPGGKTIASQFAPAYPRQVAGASYGLEMSERASVIFGAMSGMRAFVPSKDIGMGWAAREFDDSAWPVLTNQVGFGLAGMEGSPESARLREQMLGHNASVYLRVPFDLPTTNIDTLKLRLRYDDGFIAYLNGWEVARTNAPATPRWDSNASAAHSSFASVVLEETFEEPGPAYTLAQSGSSTRPKVLKHVAPETGSYLRLVNGHATNQVNSITFPFLSPDKVETVQAEFDLRWNGVGDGTERLAFLLLPGGRYQGSGDGIDLSALRQQKDPKFPGVLAVQFLHVPQNGQCSVVVYWDRNQQARASLPAIPVGNRTFQHVQIRLQYTAQDARVSVAISPTASSGNTPVEPAIVDVLIPRCAAFPARVQLAGRIGHWDQTVDLDNVRVEFMAAGSQSGEEFDLSDYLNVLSPGRNVLAFHAFNRSAGDPTFLVKAEVAAGSSSLGKTEARYFGTPTPKAGNRGGLAGVSAPPRFSTRPGVFTNNVRVELAGGEGAIHYTLDGSEPNSSSAVYSAPLELENSTLVKAKAFMLGLLPSATASGVFTVIEDGLRGFNSNLPLVILNPFGQYLSSENRSTVWVRFIEAKEGRSSLSGRADYDGPARVNIRGFSTLRQPKNSLTVRLTDENDDKAKASLFGLPKDSDWVLYAPFADKTLLRDVLAYELSNEMGRYAPRTRFVELFLDRSHGRLSQRDYMGVYVLVERIKRGKNRVNITALGPDDNQEPELSGGYIFKRDHADRWEPGFHTRRGFHFIYVDPKGEEISPEQTQYLISYMNQFEGALYGPDFRDPNRGYAAFLDVDSFIDQHWLIELSKNIDGFRYSAYLHKDRGGKLRMGPAWDWNLSFGNANYLDGSDPEGWYTPLLREREIAWFRRLNTDPDFEQRVIDRWGELRRTIFAPSRILGRVDEIAAMLEQAQQRNFRRWSILGRRVNPNDFVGDTYREEIQWMKQWIQKRIEWIDARFVAPPSLADAGRSSGRSLVLRAPTGAILYTLNGKDPRLPGGAVSSEAQRYNSPVTLNGKVSVFARVHHRGSWSSPLLVSLPPAAAASVESSP